MSEQNLKSPTTSSRVYAENYAILHEVAARLCNGGPGDIDSLVFDFRRAMTAYKICRERLETIRREIANRSLLYSIACAKRGHNLGFPVDRDETRFTSRRLRSA